MTRFQEIIEWDWADVYATWRGRGRSALHHIASACWSQADHDWVAEGATTSCGVFVATAPIAGIFTRMEAKRCPMCCDALGYPRGKGSPKNDKRCRPLVEARLKALA